MALASMAVPACGGDSGRGGGTGDRPRIVAGFYPLAEAATRVGGSRVAVTNLTPAGSEPHDLELASPAVDRIEDADLVVYLGDGFQPAIEKAAERAQGRTLDVLSDDLALLPGAPDDEGDQAVDPHVWLDPTLMKRIVERVRAALADTDPANRADYDAAAAAYTQELDALDAAYRDGLAQCERRTIVTAHGAFGYLARRYGLTEQAIAGLEPEAEPDPRRLSELAATAKAEGTTTIFTETLVSPKVAETLAKDAGVKTAVLDPVEGLSDDEQEQGATYISVMHRNLETLRTALGCR